MTTIRPLVPSDIDQYLENYLNAYPAFKALDDDCRTQHRERNLRMMQLPDVEYVGMFDDGKLVASMKLVHFQMNLYGSMAPALGLMSLAVHPLHKKKGLGLAMVKHYEQRARECGCSVAPLLPFNIAFYRKMGYGLGSKRALYHLPTANLPKCEITRDLRFLAADDFDAMIGCYDAAAEKTHGMLRKTGEELSDMRDDDVAIRLGAFDEGRMTGYMSYRFEDGSKTNFTQNRIAVDELIYQDAESLRSFLEYLRRQADLVQSVSISSGDEDFYQVLADPQDVSMEYLPFGYLQVSREFVGYQYKIVDYPAFFQATADRPAGSEEVTFCVECIGAFASEPQYLVIRAGGKQGGWSLLEYGPAEEIGKEPCRPDLSLRCTEDILSSLLLNAARLRPLYEMGLVTTDKPEQIARLDAALYYSQKPYSNTDF